MKARYSKKIGNYTVTITQTSQVPVCDPYVDAKTARAKAFLEKSGLPKEFMERVAGKPSI